MKNIFLIILFLPVFMQAQQLREYQNRALQNNPEIQSLNSSVDIAEERINEANTLGDTEFGLGYFVSEPETRTGAQKFRISVRQMMPWFGTIESRKEYAGSIVSVEDANLEIAKRKLELNVSQVYFDLYELEEKLGILQQNIDLLEVYRTMALNSIEVGKASAVEVLRLKMRQNDLEEKMEMIKLQQDALKIRLNRLLNEDSVNVEIQDTLIIPVQKTEDIDLALHPELRRFDKFAESIASSEELNQQEAAPKLGFGLDYVSVQERTDMDFSDNGKDIFMPMVSFSVPIFNNKYRSVSRQNELKQEQISFDRDATLNNLQSRLSEALNERASARIKFETQEKNLEQASDAEELLLKQYETGTIDFDDVLDIQEIQLDIQMKLIEAVTTWFKQDAVVNYLTINTQ
ncbi:MAG TPA: TolC family protein [Christiangramia sp.]|nr:TolC family protein [Christiangramia sp.]